jgi:hypothetical protein
MMQLLRKAVCLGSSPMRDITRDTALSLCKCTVRVIMPNVDAMWTSRTLVSLLVFCRGVRGSATACQSKRLPSGRLHLPVSLSVFLSRLASTGNSKFRYAWPNVLLLKQGSDHG